MPRDRARAGLLVAALCAVVPDLDLLAPYLGGDRDFHRSLTHSLLFAMCLGIACATATALPRQYHGGALRMGATAALGTLSHAITDMMTTYPLGVALMSPISASRYVLPWRPIHTLGGEILCVSLPAAMILVGMLWVRRIRIIRLAREPPLSFPLR
jgi:membrane-bound metal-dependent hydrolase YbcI (DUF457 family)